MATRPTPPLPRVSTDTDTLRALVTATDTGSLSATARALGVQLSTVSRQIAALERALETPLLTRTGRGVRPTPVGERYAARARRVLQELDDAHAEAVGEHGGRVTAMRMAAPVELSLRLLPGVLAALLLRHPGVGFEVSSEARRVSLLEEDYDVAVRLGTLPGSQLLTRRLGAVSVVLAARPARAQAVKSLADLRAAEMVRVAGTSAAMVGSLRGREVRVPVSGRVQVSTFSEAAALAACSDRVALLPSFTAVEWLREGRLLRALPGLRLPTVPLHLLYPARHRGSAVLRDLGELLSAALAQAEDALRGGSALTPR